MKKFIKVLIVSAATVLMLLAVSVAAGAATMDSSAGRIATESGGLNVRRSPYIKPKLRSFAPQNSQVFPAEWQVFAILYETPVSVENIFSPRGTISSAEVSSRNKFRSPPWLTCSEVRPGAVRRRKKDYRPPAR